MNVLVFMTAYDEERTIGDVLERLAAVAERVEHDIDVLVVDDGSTDDTPNVVARSGAILVRHPRNLGPGAATRTGYLYAVRHGYDATVRMDADGQHRPEDLPKLLRPIADDDADIVIGSRFKTETGYETSAVRGVGIRFYSWLISVVTGDRVYDITSGFRALRIEVGAEHARKLPRGIIAIDRGVREGLSAYRIVEVPVTMRRREHGESYLNPGRLLKYPVYSVYSFMSALFSSERR